ncbi:MAG: hypothetical protein KDA32_06935 [Phycisphaerales bacterium]|nr:hypothetical protein [Phycisphaerales bacterium]
MRLRRLTDTGVERLIDFLDSFKSDDPAAYPANLLTDEDASAALPVEIEIDEKRQFPRRFEAAEYLYRQLAPLRTADGEDYERDRGVWAWLSLLWFDQLCPTDKHGRRNPGDIARWVPVTSNSRRYYRHLLFGPYLVYSAHCDQPSAAVALLATPPDAPGDIVEQIVSRQDLVSSPTVVETITSLYYTPNGTRRRGAAGQGAGSVRRLADVLLQFDRTFDIRSLQSSEILNLLPSEFSRFRTAS